MAGDFGNYAGGGALALLLLREVFAFLGKQKPHGGGPPRFGDLDPADCEHRIRSIITTESDRMEEKLESRAALLAEKAEVNRRVLSNTRDIVRDVAKKLGLKVNYVND